MGENEAGSAAGVAIEDESRCGCETGSIGEGIGCEAGKGAAIGAGIGANPDETLPATGILANEGGEDCSAVWISAWLVVGDSLAFGIACKLPETSAIGDGMGATEPPLGVVGAGMGNVAAWLEAPGTGIGPACPAIPLETGNSDAVPEDTEGVGMPETSPTEEVDAFGISAGPCESVSANFGISANTGAGISCGIGASDGSDC